MRSLNPWPAFPSDLDPPVARSLSIQFILQTLIDGFNVVEELKDYVNTEMHGDDLKEEISHLSILLEKFYLLSLENPFAKKGGVLDRLCFYSEILLQASHVKESELVIVMEEMRTSLLKSKSQLMLWKKLPATFSLCNFRQLVISLSKELFHQLTRFFATLIPFLREARSDENVLAFLLEKKAPLNMALGSGCIEDVLQSLFPAGHDQLRAVIHEGYTRRGFSDFLSSLEPLIDSIQWEAPCHSQQTR